MWLGEEASYVEQDLSTNFAHYDYTFISMCVTVPEQEYVLG